jgi:hypothetical protein
MTDIVRQYLDLLDSQRETAFTALDGLDEAHLWQRPAPKTWSPGELVDHSTQLIASSLPYARFAWRTQRRRAEKRRAQAYATEIEDPYRKASFPHWVGFMWTPRHTPRHPVRLERLKSESRALHAAVRAFYEDKEEAFLGNTFLYDPLFGSINLIVSLRIGIYHDQLHFDEIVRRAADPGKP